MDLEGIMLSEISHREKDKCQVILHVKYKKKKKTIIGNRIRFSVMRGGCGVLGDVIYNMMTKVYNVVWYI